MQIGGLQKTTLIDYPGKVACTVFCVGCNFRCPWCYNPELVLPREIKKHPKIIESEFFKFLKSRKGLIEGVVISGGEPTIHKDLSQLCKKIKKIGFSVKLDTNGSNPKMLKKLINNKLVDYVAMDVKAPLNSQKYNKAVGKKINLKKLMESIKIIKESGVNYEFRTTLVPSINNLDDIVEIAKEIFPAKRYFLQNFEPKKTIKERCKKIKPYSGEYLLRAKKTVVPLFEFCDLRD